MQHYHRREAPRPRTAYHWTPRSWCASHEGFEVKPLCSSLSSIAIHKSIYSNYNQAIAGGTRPLLRPSRQVVNVHCPEVVCINIHCTTQGPRASVIQLGYIYRMRKQGRRRAGGCELRLALSYMWYVEIMRRISIIDYRQWGIIEDKDTHRCIATGPHAGPRSPPHRAGPRVPTRNRRAARVETSAVVLFLNGL
jgi:hypothetical protein